MRPTAARRACGAAAILGYLVVSLVVFRGVLAAPSSLLPYPSLLDEHSGALALDHWDQSMVVATTIRNARLLVTEPWNLFADVGQCYPMPRAYTLGEHMFGLGLLAAAPWAITGDPILSYNVALVLSLWIPAITMYFLSLRFTGSPGAAFVAGLAFALVPGRIIDPSHPYVHGDLWAPAVLLFLHRLFVTARWRDALGLAFFLNLEVAESLYPLISTGLMAGTYGLYLLFRHRGRLAKVAAPLLVAIGLVAAGTWIVLGPYLETGATWNLLSGRRSLLLPPGSFGPGGDYFPGWLVTALVAIALADRVRGPRRAFGEDPRLAFAAGGLLVAWSAVSAVPIPGLGIAIESPFVLLRGIVPGLEAVRALSAVGIGVGIATSFLAGYGVLVLEERLSRAATLSAFRPPPWAPVAVAVACAVLLASLRLVPSWAEAGFGRRLDLSAWMARPPQEDIDLLARIGSGPVVHHPLVRENGKKRLDVATALLLATYDPRPLAACYNSFQSAVNDQVSALSGALPSAEAAEALGALGFETVLVSRRPVDAERLRRFEDERAADPASRTRLAPAGETRSTAAYRLAPQDSVERDFGLLAPATTGETTVMMPRALLELPIANRGRATFVHPDPLAPSDLVLRWRDADGRVVHEEPKRALLPIALAAGSEIPFVLDVATPETPGHYEVTLARSEAPDHVLARRAVDLPRLEDLLAPAQLALHLNRDFVRDVLVDAGIDYVAPPEDRAEMMLAPGVESAADVAARAPLHAHWIDVLDESVHVTDPVRADVSPAAAERRIDVRLSVPAHPRPWVVLLAPADDPSTVLAGRTLFPGEEPRPPRPSP